MPENTLQSPRQRRAQRNRNLILQAAMELLVQDGPQNLSLRAVARRSDYSPAALYEYFDSREALLAALWAEVDGSLREFLRSVPENLPPSDRLVALGMNYIRFARQNPQLYRLYFIDPAGSLPYDELVRSSAAFHLLVDVLSTGIEQDDFKAHNGFELGEMAYACWALLHGITSLQLNLPEGHTTDFDLLNLKAIETLVIGIQALRM
jgi:AcrR family transcriptional regulator